MSAFSNASYLTDSYSTNSYFFDLEVSEDFYQDNINDAILLALPTFTGTANDRIYAYLGSLGHVGALPDRIASANGKLQVLRDLNIIK